MPWISRLISGFALLSTFLVVAPGLLSDSFGPYPLMKDGDVLNMVTTLLLIPLYWLLFQLRPELLPRPRETLLLLVLAAAWSAGQGMHPTRWYPGRAGRQHLRPGLGMGKASPATAVAILPGCLPVGTGPVRSLGCLLGWPAGAE
jgi:hypothetical protein